MRSGVKMTSIRMTTGVCPIHAVNLAECQPEVSLLFVIQPEESECQEQRHEENHRLNKARDEFMSVLVNGQLRERSDHRCVSE